MAEKKAAKPKTPKPPKEKKPRAAPKSNIEIWSKRIAAMVIEFVRFSKQLTPLAIEHEMSIVFAEKNIALVGTADYVGFIESATMVNLDAPGVFVQHPSDRVVVLDWKTSMKSDGMYTHTRDVLPQLALYSILARSEFGLDYYPAVAPVRFVYSIAESRASECTVNAGALLEVTDKTANRALAMLFQDAAINAAINAHGVFAPRPDAGNYKCTGCQWHAPCASWVAPESCS